MNHLKNVAVVCLVLGWSAGGLLRAEDTINSLKQKRLDLMSQIVSQLNLEYAEGGMRYPRRDRC